MTVSVDTTKPSKGEEATVAHLFDRRHTRLSALLEQVTYPWAVLPRLKEYLARFGETLSPDEFEQPYPQIWVARDAEIADTATLIAPCIIDRGAHIRPGAFLRGGVMVGKEAVVGNSTELKNAILFDRVQAPHYNYIGDAILGYGAHLGAGAVTSNLKSDRTPVCVRVGDVCFETGMQKIGAFVGDLAEIGCNAVLCPGSVVGRGTIVYPLSRVRGFVPPNHIYKDAEHIIPRRKDET